MNGKPFSSQYAVYPHLRGAYRLRVLARRITPGSSPPMWGIRRCGRSEKTSSRFIPTYVGHTCGPIHPGTPASVHPHIRGAYVPDRYDGCRNGGSSPPTWGIHQRRQRHKKGDRFIPTYVGHTQQPVKSLHHISVHPHIRGAYVQLHQLEAVCSRFIPTYVGHTTRSFPYSSRCSVHPHIRGAYLLTSVGLLSLPGSSPHTWGILAAVSNLINSGRFIPTYVGHTCSPAIHATTRAVHPHIRGAYTGPP